jgi:hypothetical protein
MLHTAPWGQENLEVHWGNSQPQILMLDLQEHAESISE